MAGNTRFHSKHHAPQHHSVRTNLIASYPDAATDPLGSYSVPYQGPFHINGVLNVENKLHIPGNSQAVAGEGNAVPDYSAYWNTFADPVLINSSLSATGDVEIHGNLRVKESIYVDKNVYLSGGDGGFLNFGDSSVDHIRFNAHVGSDVIPTIDKTYHLGTANKRWNTIFGHTLNLDGNFSLTDGTSCVFKADIAEQRVLIGTCDTDPGVTLHVKGGKTKLETSLDVTDVATFSTDIVVGGDVYISDGEKVIFGDVSRENYISANQYRTIVNSSSAVNIAAPGLTIETPTINITPPDTQIHLDRLTFGSCLLYLNEGINRVGIGTCAPASPVHIDGGTTVSGPALIVTSNNTEIINSQTSISTNILDLAATQGTSLVGDTVHIRGSSQTSSDAIRLDSKILTIDAPSRVDLNTGDINLAGQDTHVSVTNSTRALRIDGSTVVVDSSNDRVGINKIDPQATLHVGGNAIFDNDVLFPGGTFDVDNNNTTIECVSSAHIHAPWIHLWANDTDGQIELDGPLLNIDTPEIDVCTQDTTISVREAVNSLRFIGCNDVGILGKDSILSIDGANDRVGISTDTPDSTLSVSGTVSIEGDSTEISSTAVDINSTTTSISAADYVDISTPEIKIPQVTKVSIQQTTDALNINNNTVSINGFNNRVGIGTNDPRYTLDISGIFRTVGDKAIVDTTGDTTIDADNTVITSSTYTQILGGSVGVGVSQPKDQLHVRGNIFIEDVSGEITFETGANHYNWQLAVQESVDGGFQIGVGDQDADASDDIFTPLFVIEQSGKVGIGTGSTIPTHDLQVVGDIKSDSIITTDTTTTDIIVSSLSDDRLIYKDATSNKLVTSELLQVDGTNGKLGINTSSINSDAHLHVGGDVHLSKAGITSMLSSSYSLADALIDSTTTTGTVLAGGVGQHVVLDLRNDNDGDSIAFRHSSNNSGIVDTVGFLYYPSSTGAKVGINTTINELGPNSFVVDGDTHLKGDLSIDGSLLIQGATAELDIQTLEITDKNVVVNKGGTTVNSVDAGLIIYGGDAPGDDTTIGYIKVHASDPSLLVAKAPTGSILTIDTNSDSTLRLDQDLFVTGVSKINQDVSTLGNVVHNSLQLTSKLINNIDIEDVRSDLDDVMTFAYTTLQDEVDVTQTGAGLAGDGSYVVNSSANYINTASSLNNADDILDSALKTEETNRIATDSALSTELDDTQTGAGLAADGTYTANNNTNYIANAGTLREADELLDSSIRGLENLLGHGLSPSANNHKTRLDNHDAEDLALNQRITNNTTYIDDVVGNLNSRLDDNIAPDRVTATNGSGKVVDTDLTSWISGTNNQIAVTTDDSGGVVLSLPHGDFTSDNVVSCETVTLNGDSITSNRLMYVDNNDTLQTVNDLTSWISGTTNQVDVINDLDGTITLNLPQDINTTASPVFDNIELTSLTKNKFLTIGSTGTLSTVDLGSWITSGPGITITPSGIDNTGATVNHDDTSTQTSVTNSTSNDAQGTFRKVIQDISVDEFGHVTNLISADVSYDVSNTTLPGLVPVRPTVNPAGTFLNGNNEWTVYPDVVGKIESVHPSLLVLNEVSTDTIDLDLDSVLEIGSLTDNLKTGLVYVKGSSSDNNYNILLGERRYPRIQLKDTTTNGKVFNIWNLGQELRFGTNGGTPETSSMIIGPGDNGTVGFNGLVIGRETGKAFKGDLEGNADTASAFDITKTVTLKGDVHGILTTDFSENAEVNVTISTGYVSEVEAGQNIIVSDHDGAGPERQTIATASQVAFDTVTANTVSSKKYITTSDIALKENVASIGGALDKVMNLTGVSFNWKGDSNKQLGMIANDVEQVIPEAVDVDDSGNKSIDYGGVISYLVECIKDLKTEINELKETK